MKTPIYWSLLVCRNLRSRVLEDIGEEKHGSLMKKVKVGFLYSAAYAMTGPARFYNLGTGG